VPPSNLTQFLNEHLRVKKKYYAIYKFIIYDFKELNDTMKKIIENHRSDFFKTCRASGVNINTNRPKIQLHLVNPGNNVRDDRHSNIAIYAWKKIQKFNCNKYSTCLFIILDDTISSEMISINKAPII
jgi:hypothetical protein